MINFMIFNGEFPKALYYTAVKFQMYSFSYKNIINFRKKGAGCYINMTRFVEGLVAVRKEPNKLFYSKKIHISRKYSVIPSSYTWRSTEKWLSHHRWPFLRGSFFLQKVWYSDALKNILKITFWIISNSICSECSECSGGKVVLRFSLFISFFYFNVASHKKMSNKIKDRCFNPFNSHGIKRFATSECSSFEEISISWWKQCNMFAV